MNAASAAAFGSASTASTMDSTLSSCTTHIDWGSKVWNFLLSFNKYSWEPFPLCYNYLVQIVMIVCCARLLLTRLYSRTLVILIGLDLGSLLRLTIIFCSDDHLRVHTISLFSARYWTYQNMLRSSWSIMLKYRPGWSAGGLVSFYRRLDSLIVDNVELSFNIYCIMW